MRMPLSTPAPAGSGTGTDRARLLSDTVSQGVLGQFREKMRLCETVTGTASIGGVVVTSLSLLGIYLYRR